MEALVSGSPLAPLIAQCCSDESPAIRQSAFALVGDLARASPGVLAPVLPVIVTLALQILEPSLMNQVNAGSAIQVPNLLGRTVPVPSLLRIVHNTLVILWHALVSCSPGLLTCVHLPTCTGHA